MATPYQTIEDPEARRLAAHMQRRHAQRAHTAAPVAFATPAAALDDPDERRLAGALQQAHAERQQRGVATRLRDPTGPVVLPEPVAHLCVQLQEYPGLAQHASVQSQLRRIVRRDDWVRHPQVCAALEAVAAEPALAARPGIKPLLTRAAARQLAQSRAAPPSARAQAQRRVPARRRQLEHGESA